MGLEKAILSGKEHRKLYYDSRAVDSWCRNHGKCFICRENRTYKNQKRIEAATQKMNEYGREENTIEGSGKGNGI